MKWFGSSIRKVRLGLVVRTPCAGIGKQFSVDVHVV